MSTAHDPAATNRGPRIVLYSDDVDVRAQVRLAIGPRLEHGAAEIEWVETATPAAVVSATEAGGVDLLVLDGEADKLGGMGLGRQLKEEVYRCPPVLVLTGRPQDAWLASWSNADATVSRPLDPRELHSTVVELLASQAVAG